MINCNQCGYSPDVAPLRRGVEMVKCPIDQKMYCRDHLPYELHDKVIRRLLVKKVLEESHANQWTLQGLGMFRLYLSKEVRLHVWDPRFAVENVSTLHTHPWDFTSDVIVGSIQDCIYKILPNGVPNYQEQRIVCGPGGCATGDPRTVSIHLNRRRVISSGGGYNLYHDEIHESKPEPGTITIVTRRFKEDTEHAEVYHEIGKPWISAEPRKATVGEVNAMRKLALEVIG